MLPNDILAKTAPPKAALGAVGSLLPSRMGAALGRPLFDFPGLPAVFLQDDPGQFRLTLWSVADMANPTMFRKDRWDRPCVLWKGHDSSIAALIFDCDACSGECVGLDPPYLLPVIQRDKVPQDMALLLSSDGDAVSLDPIRLVRVVRPDGMGAGPPQERLPLLDAPCPDGPAHPIEDAVLPVGLQNGFCQFRRVIHKV